MMNPVVMKMLIDADMRRQIEHQRYSGYRGPWVLALAGLLVAAIPGSSWIA
ncbi:MAG: hypothetical protein ACE5M4_03165 [Anaerolineales bacterium]